MERYQAQEPLSPGQWHKAIVGASSPEEIGERLHSDKSRLWAEPILRYISPNQSVLELGSGTGELSGILAKNGRKVTLLDYSSKSLEFSKAVFKYAKLNAEFVHADLLKPLPFDDNSFDCVWSSGLLEHFTNDQLNFIMNESVRVSKNMVISMVPNANSFPYRVGKWYQESKGLWIWGKEKPRFTLRNYFQRAGLRNIVEYSIDPEHSLGFLNSLRPKFIKNSG